MTFRPSFATAHNPLRHLPSVLAMHDVQPRVHQVFGAMRGTEDDLVAVLKLDPLAVLRGLRAAHAPVFRQTPSLPTVREMVQRLGKTISRQLFVCPPIEVAPESQLRPLWRHSVATAIAAHDLANHSGLIDPEAAYLLGLLNDLPSWLQWLQPQEHAPGVWVLDCITQWQLPMALVSQLRTGRSAFARDFGLLPTDVGGVLRAAKRLAGLAGMPSPTPEDPHTAALAIADKADLQAADRLRERVEMAFAQFGLQREATPLPATAKPLANGSRTGSLDEVVLTILSCARSNRYRGIVTALAAAAVRYGAYDRAFYGKWLPSTTTMTLRSKADGSSRRIATHRYLATATEAQLLRTALAENRPALLQAPARGLTGLLAGLSTDELIAVPLNGDFLQPAFLLLDRSTTLTPIDLSRDHAMAMTLGHTGSLLIENLLLRGRRQRAQKFALTDSLTHLFNRRMGMLTLEQEVARCERSTRPLTVLMCDLDHFKLLNDTLGHGQGDNALRATAEVLRHTLRKGDSICRYGGEEFLVVLPDTTAADATVLAARLFTSVHQRGEELGLPITISIGLTTFRPGDSIESLLHRADHALYASKGYGRNRFSADVETNDDDLVPQSR